MSIQTKSMCVSVVSAGAIFMPNIYNSFPAIASFAIHYELRTEQTSRALFQLVENVYGENCFSSDQEYDDGEDVNDDDPLHAWKWCVWSLALCSAVCCIFSFFIFVNAFVFSQNSPFFVVISMWKKCSECAHTHSHIHTKIICGFR